MEKNSSNLFRAEFRALRIPNAGAKRNEQRIELYQVCELTAHFHRYRLPAFMCSISSQKACVGQLER